MDTSKIVNKEIEVYAVGHHSTRGDLAHKLFEWGVLLDGNYASSFYGDQVVSGAQTSEFYKKIKPLLPSGYAGRVVAPAQTGDCYTLSILVNEFQDSATIETLLKEHFPNVTSDIPKVNQDTVLRELSKRRVSERIIRSYIASHLDSDEPTLPMIEFEGKPMYFGHLGTGLSPSRVTQLLGAEDKIAQLYSTLVLNQPHAHPVHTLADPMITIFLTEALRLDALYNRTSNRMEEFSQWNARQREAVEQLRSSIPSQEK